MKTSPIVGLLGGIGSGKSTVAAILACHGAFVLDADQCARELLLDPEVRQAVEKVFGAEFFRKDGSIDRAKLADRVFTDEKELSKINAIIHPRVRSRFREQVAAARTRSPERIIVLDIPLLLGSELQSLCDLLVMVRASLRSRLERVKRTRGWSQEELMRREARQPPMSQKESAAAVVIDNDGSLEDLEERVKVFLETLSP